jgi:Protein of unknown function (DUF3429)
MVSDTNVIPRTPLLLGWAGVIPFAVLSIAAALDVSLPWFEARSLLIGYSVCILSFMGGVQWGLAMLTPAERRSRTRFAVSVTPALFAWISLALPSSIALLVLALSFASLFAYDAYTVRAAGSPTWYLPYRRQLTVAVIASLLVALF